MYNNEKIILQGFEFNEVDFLLVKTKQIKGPNLLIEMEIISSSIGKFLIFLYDEEMNPIENKKINTNNNIDFEINKSHAHSILTEEGFNSLYEIIEIKKMVLIKK